MGSWFSVRDQAHTPCTGSRSLNPGTAREVPGEVPTPGPKAALTQFQVKGLEALR